MLPSLFLALGALNAAQAIALDRERCYTYKGLSPVETLSTTSSTIFYAATKVIVVGFEPTEVVTPPAAVVTDVLVHTESKTTTAKPPKGVPTTTITKTAHTTKTITTGAATTTKTTTVTTTTTSTSTSTIPTSPGFVPISSSLPGSQNPPDKSLRKQPLANPVLRAKAKKYPTGVSCLIHRTLETTVTSTNTLAALTSTVAAATERATVISTFTDLCTHWPAAGSTKTVTKTITKTSTVSKPSTTITKTSTRTSTTTTIEPGPTFYAACASNNLMPTYQNETVDFLAGDNQPDDEADTEVATLYECCVACFDLPNGCAAGALDHINDPSFACEIWLYKDPRPQNASNHRMDTWGCADGGSGAFNGYGGEVTDYIYFGGCD